MKKIQFFDVKGKKKFSSTKYKFKKKKTKTRMVYFAVSKAPSGIEAYRIISKDFWEENKK